MCVTRTTLRDEETEMHEDVNANEDGDKEIVKWQTTGNSEIR